MGTKQTADELIKKARGLSINGKNIRIDFVYQSKRCRETLKLPVTPANVKFAIRKREAIMHEIAVGTFDYRQHFPESKMVDRFLSKSKVIHLISLKELSEKYVKLREADLGLQTIRNFKNRIRQAVDAIGGDILVSALRPEHIMEMRAKLIEDRAASTVNVLLTDFGGFLKYVQENGYLDIDLRCHCKRFKYDQPEPDPFTQNEINQILGACRHQSTRNLITLAVNTGLRTGELCALCWEDVDLDKGFIQVRRNIIEGKKFKLPKRDKIRKVYLMPPAIKALRDQRKYTFMKPAEHIEVHQKDKGRVVKESVRPVFRPGYELDCNWGASLVWFTVGTLRYTWERLLKRTTVRYRVAYQMRHTYASMCLTAGGKLAFIAKQMGHKDLAMLIQVYGRWMDDDSKTEIDQLWNLMKTSYKRPKDDGGDLQRTDL